MSAGLQELLALLLVAVVVGLYLYRRRRRPAGSCGDCASGPSNRDTAEKIIHFHRRRPPAG